ncbi:toprim domain-containing protein [Bacillus cereus]|uniref:toprim domain-containing protein n=1 Tax=Bacillus cereus TaxID=1396 RepID=UPI00156B4200|nr:toprim domain-containing protein [Bacillus cereus]NRQ71953.1 toprim domain-containing protein [Bacillus cereus]
MKIRGQELDIDYLEEIEGFDVWNKQRVRENKFHSCSPFRTERRPSFAVNLDNGTWIDSGSDNEEWRKGHFVQLLSWLRQETWEETEAYLLERYANISIDTEVFEMDFDFNLTKPELCVLGIEDLRPFLFRHAYLTNRGISEKVQRSFKIGYDKKGGAVVIPWFDKTGRMVNFKFRAIKNKYFWYHEGGQPIKHHVYGLHFIHKLGIKEVFICESETDCLFLWTNGFPAIALGGANLSAKQRQLILDSPIETLIIATDNDAAGKRISRSLVTQLAGLVNLCEISIPNQYKDVNDIPVTMLKQVCTSHKYVDITKGLQIA